MEGIGSEVSHKIRAAIKAKLIELGAYIDDELPDYIMVMVANKRSRHQMDEDLHLFLGSNTKIFTSWLHTVLQKLQEVTVATFDTKQKDTQGGKISKRKNSNSDDSTRKDRKSEEKSKGSKKHTKKHKEGKKLKKAKHKSKDKEKLKGPEKRQAQVENIESNRDKITQIDDEGGDSVYPAAKADEKTKDKENEEGKGKISSPSKENTFRKSESVEKDRFFRSERGSSSSKSNSPSHDLEEPEKAKSKKDCTGSGTPELRKYPSKTSVIEDEFNIEPLQPNKTEDQLSSQKNNDLVEEGTKSESQVTTGMTIKAPTKELLKEHDKIHSGTEDNTSKEKKKSFEGSDGSLSPEEIRKQLLLSRAKKKLEQSKIPGRMKSNSPEVEVVETNSSRRGEERFSVERTGSSSKRPFQRSECDVEGDRAASNRDGIKLNLPVEGRRSSPVRKYQENETGQSGGRSRSDQKKNVISISKSLEMEKNLGVKSEDGKRNKNKTTTSPRKKPVPSRIVTIPEPEAPEISSIVKVKPREFIPKDMQANKVLILKAVADAEKSIATVQSRNDGESKFKKSEGIFTKDLRGKRFEKLAVTLSNVQSGPVDRDKTKRMVSVDSENTNALDRKTESLQDSELSQGFRSIPELTLKNISSKSEDQFISSKTSAMEKNDKYIHCWLEGVEKAVKDDEIVNPREMDDLQGHFSDDGKNDGDDSLKDEDRRRKKLKTRDDERPGSNEPSKTLKTGEKNNVKSNQEDGPQIVVTLDGLTSKAIKDIIVRNRDAPNGPLLVGSSGKKADQNDEDEDGSKIRYKNVDLSRNASTSRRSDSEERDRVTGFEKISERFGRINKTSEAHEFKEKYYEFERERYEKKYLKYQGTDKEKHYEKLKDKYASAGESKNKKLIARLSEKFGKVDREFEDKKRKYSAEDVRYYGSRRIDRGVERDGKYRKLDRKSLRSDETNSERMRWLGVSSLNAFQPFCSHALSAGGTKKD